MRYKYTRIMSGDPVDEIQNEIKKCTKNQENKQVKGAIVG